jgi:hypothetical protein
VEGARCDVKERRLSVRATRRVVLVALLLLVPAPMLVVTAARMPPVAYGLYAAVCSAVALTEGSAGPIPALILMFGLHFVVYGLLAWLAAFVVARALARVTPRLRAMIVVVAVAAAAAIALGRDVYLTPFARTRTSNLIEALT